MTEEEFRGKIAEELFEVWKDGTGTWEDDWANVTFESLPESHQSDYYPAADRIIAYCKEAGCVRLAKDQIFPEMAEWGTEMHRVQKDYGEKMYDEEWRRVILEEEQVS